jgi:hypothetical protein
MKINVLPFFIPKIRVPCEGEVCGEVRFFPIPDADVETPFALNMSGEFLRFAWQGSKLRRRDTAFGSRFVGRGNLQNDIFFSRLRSKNEGEGQTGRR